MTEPKLRLSVGAFLAIVFALGAMVVLITRVHAPALHDEPATRPTNPTMSGATGSHPVSSGEPSPAFSGVVAGTPTPNPTPTGYAEAVAQRSYVVRQGDTLSRIALTFGRTVDEIAAANNIDPDAIWPGQTLIIPAAVPQRTGPALKLLPDSELVYGPAYIHFDLAGFVAAQGGYLAGYTEQVEGQSRTGAEIVQLVAQRQSVGPRVLLALLEDQAGWVTDPDPPAETRYYPMGRFEERLEGLFYQLSWTAAELNDGYYGWKYGGWATLLLDDGSRVAIAPGLNPGTVAVQNYAARVASGAEWEALIGPQGFAATYRRLFGDPFTYAVEPLIPPGLTQPELRLPWEAGETWFLTGGPHGGWGRGSGWAALDFAPAANLGCQISPMWTTAAAAGLVLRSEEGEVVVDLAGDGYEQSGWVLTYLHIDTQGRIEAGTWVERGERIGRPSCEGGYSIATHLHFARRYNGEWIPAGSGPVPMVLSGWTAHDGDREYAGRMTRGDQERIAREAAIPDLNGLVSDNSLP